MTWFIVFVRTKISYYQLNRNRSLEKEKDMSHNGGGNEKAAEHYLSNGEVLRENAKKT